MSFCTASSTPLRDSLPPAGIAEKEQEHTRASVLCWTGLEPGANSCTQEFFYPVPLPGTKTALLQFVTMYLAAFIPVVPLVVTERGNNWLESTPEKSPSLPWDTRIHRISASAGEVLRASTGPHIFSSYHSLYTDYWHETVGLIVLGAVRLLTQKEKVKAAGEKGKGNNSCGKNKGEQVSDGVATRIAKEP